MTMHGTVRIVAACLSMVILSACVTERMSNTPVSAPVAVKSTPDFGPIVDEDGQCTSDISFDPAPYKGKSDDALIGLGECQIVALHGEPPLSVMSGASASSKRETTMLYMEASGKAVYLFSSNKLTRVVR
jgi:hypothetical protein